MKLHGKKIILCVVGIVATIGLAIVVWLSAQTPVTTQLSGPTSETTTSASLEFDSEELVYSGSGVLDLMEGVHATDSDGTDLTDQVNAVITADGTLTRKTVRYSVYGADGEVVTRQRSLLLQNYTGPTLEIAQPLQFNSAELPRLIDYLQEEDLLRAVDGYGMEITGQVTCVREHQGQQTYDLTFQVINQFQDSVQRTVSATITGDVNNPSIQLTTQEVQITAGTDFQPLAYILSVNDGSNGTSLDAVQIDSNVNPNQPGRYRVTYQLYSSDHTAKTTAVLQVTVQ